MLHFLQELFFGNRKTIRQDLPERPGITAVYEKGRTAERQFFFKSVFDENGILPGPGPG